MITLRELAERVARVAPTEAAEEWDNVGLQVGDPAWRVRRALVALEVSPETIDEAVRVKAEAIVAHHPLVFHPLRSIRLDERVGALTARLLEKRIGLIVAHTNLDKSPSGPNHALAEALGVTVEGWLRPEFARDQVKLVVFTPAGYERRIIDAIDAGGGGVIGNYSHCSFRAPGTGTFWPRKGAIPFLGEKGRFEEVEETRLEAVVPKRNLSAVLRSMLKAHPYEEPAYDILPLEPVKAERGLGVVGELRDEVSLKRLRAMALSRIRPLLPQAARSAWRSVRCAGEERRTIRRVAICTGAGGSVIQDAAGAGAECLITGEINYHDAVEANALGLAVLALGHFASEAAGMPRFAAALADEARRNGRSLSKQSGAIEFLVAQSERDPFDA
ncbi:MAG: Nif3-like dinuclear metal center hexameric protein [Candidatus Sumerlaeota bacterium]|nr:Nif3-like dinuclear metal center hexameric protein [Candidatus Sumerlaeota bacterium]